MLYKSRLSSLGKALTVDRNILMAAAKKVKEMVSTRALWRIIGTDVKAL